MNDAERVSQDPTFRLIGSEKIWERGAALTSRLQSFETEVLARDENLAGLEAINRGLIAQAETIESPQRVVLDMDSTEIPVYGQQEQSAYNGHFESTCYHPLLLFSRGGDCLAGKLRPGNVHSADGWEELLLPEIERQQKLGKEVVFRADAAFAKPEIYEALEERGAKYAIRIPGNGKLERWHKSLKSECIRPGTPLTREDAMRLIRTYVDHYNTVRLHSAIGYVTPHDMLAGRQTEIHAARDRKLQQARSQRQLRLSNTEQFTR
jgi:hypothetical protein